MEGGVRGFSSFGKKGSVTIYIIIGLVFLIVTSVGIYVVTQQSESSTLKERSLIQKLPSEFQAPVILVQECLRKISKEGLEMMGQQGGHSSLDGLEFGFYSTESDGVRFGLEEGAPSVPYWYHLESRSDCVNCKFGGHAISLKSMEANLEKYIDSNLGTCIDDFSSLKDQYSIEVTGNLKSEVNLGKTVSVELKYPIRILTAEVEFKHENFAIGLDVDIPKLRDLAEKVTNYQIKNAFLENNLLSALSTSNGIDKDLPPTAGTDMSPVGNIWVKSKVRGHIEDMIRDYIFLTTFPGTRNFLVIEGNSELEQGYLYSNIVDVLDIAGKDKPDETYSLTDVNLFFFGGPSSRIYLDIYPSEGELIRPEATKTKLAGIFPMTSQDYSFKYNIAYPVIVELRDVTAFNGEGFSFMFALEANIRNNAEFQDKEYEVFFLPSTGQSLFGSPKQRISGTVSFSAVDDNSNALPEVEVSYECGSESVSLGYTDENGKFGARLPICFGGVVKFSKFGYYGDAFPLTTDIGVTDEVNGKLFKFIKSNAKIGVRRPEDLSSLEGINPGDLTIDMYNNVVNKFSSLNNEEVFLTLQRVKDSPYHEGHTTMVLFDEQNEQGEVELAQGKYTINAMYLDNNGVVVPADVKSIRYCDKQVGPACVKHKTRNIPLPEIELNPAPIGGGVMDESTGAPWEVSFEDLNKDEVTFFVLRNKDPKTHEEMGGLLDPTGLSQKYPSLVRPKWE